MQKQAKRSSILDWMCKKPKAAAEEREKTDSSELEHLLINKNDNNGNAIVLEDTFRKEYFTSGQEHLTPRQEYLTPNQDCLTDKTRSRKKEVNEDRREVEVEEDDEAGVDYERAKFLTSPVDKFGRTPEDREYDQTTLFISEKELAQMTPCEEQFWRIKMEHFDSVVFFKKGKFYELFEGDAEMSADLFGLKLTKRGGMKMTGVPEMSLEHWVGRFVEKGHKVAVVDQKENSVSQNMKVKMGEAKKKVIERELKEVITEVTHSQEGFSICALVIEDKTSEVEAGGGKDEIEVAIAVFKPMESEFHVQTVGDNEDLFRTNSLIKMENVRVIISERRVPCVEKRVAVREDMWGEEKRSEVTLAEIKKTLGESFSDNEEKAVKILVSYLHYLKYKFTSKIAHSLEKTSRKMYIDGKTIETLGLVCTDRKNAHESLFSQIDRTKTRMGRRLLRQWVVQPLFQIEEIERRYETVEALEKSPVKAEIEHALGKIDDIADLIKKGKNGKIKAEEIRKLISSLESAGKVHKLLLSAPFSDSHRDTRIPELVSKLESYGVYKEIVSGFDTSGEIMPLRTDPDLIAAEKNKEKAVETLAAYAKKESHRAGVEFAVKKIGRDHLLETASAKTLTGKYIAFGSTKNTRRYTTPELKSLSEEFLEADERIAVLGQSSVHRISARIEKNEEILRSIVSGVAELDCFLSLSKIEGTRAVHGPDLRVRGLSNTKNTHIPNSIEIDRKNRLLVVTGPNMAGKSTFLRNVSVAVVLRQIGARVPAAYFESPVYDRIFTRIGAGDRMEEGESTFQVEMKETASILNEATENSFVIVDELGRGTSTREGSAISLAVKEYLKKIRCTVMYSTHFFNAIVKTDRVTRMAYKHVRNAQNIEEMLYLYKLEEGECRDSCGIEICKIAKVPNSVIERAKEIKVKRAQNTCR